MAISRRTGEAAGPTDALVRRGCARGLDLNGDLTLLDLIRVVQEFTRTEQETVDVVYSLLAAGRVRLRSRLPGNDDLVG